MNNLKVLIGCEESQEVTKAFRNLGIEAYSCDILPCSGGHPEWHLPSDIFDIINMIEWDCLIAFPPCTYLTVTANRSFLNNPERWEKRLNAVRFVYELMNVDIKHIAIENPQGVISTHIRKPNQYIEPYQFGHKHSKKTGLWLKNLPLLKPTKIVEPEFILSKNGKKYSKIHWSTSSTNNPNNAKLRSKTFPGVAKAMAEQWSEYLLNEKHKSQ